MRKLILSIMAITLIALLAGPAMAKSGDGDVESQDVTITVESCLEWETCENPIEFTITCDDYDDGFVYPSNLPTGRTSLDVWTNVYWNVQISHDAYTTGPMPATWVISVREDADATWFDLDATPTDYFPAPMDPTAHDQWIFNYKLWNFAPEDDWAGVHSGISVYYSVHAT